MDGRLVEQQRARLLRQGHRQRHPLLLAAREALVGTIGQPQQSAAGQGAIHSRRICTSGRLQKAGMRRPSKVHHLAHREGERHLQILRDHRQRPRRLAPAETLQRLPRQPDPPRQRRQRPAQGAEQGGLAAAVPAQQRHHLARCHGEVDAA